LVEAVRVIAPPVPSSAVAVPPADDLLSRARERAPLVLGVFWLLVGTAAALPAGVSGWLGGEPLGAVALLGLFLPWQVWTPLSLLVLAIARRAPPTWPLAPRAALLHGAGLAFCIGVDVAARVLSTWAVAASSATPLPFGRLVRDTLAAGGAGLPLLVYVALVAVDLAAEFYRRYRDRAVEAAQLEARLMEARLQVLKMQLNPHFLFNTLHSISALMHRDLDAADRMISVLSDLLRLSLETAGKQEIALQQELDFLERYLEIETTRFSDRLVVNMDIEPRALDALVPNLILQPIVENAIRHGIALRAGPGQVEVSARVLGARLQLEVRDNGPGLKTSPREGIGLSNTRARLAQLYGKDHELEVRNAPLGGLVVRMNLPCVFAPEAATGEAEVMIAEEAPLPSERRRAVASPASSAPAAVADRQSSSSP
jgi:two-component system LytT family sensor kinase